MSAAHFERQVLTAQEQLRVLLTPLQHLVDQRLFDPAAAPVLQPLRRCGAVHQRLTAAGKIHRAAVVGVDQAEIPEFVALVQVGHAWRGHAQQALRQAVEGARASDRLRRLGQ
ncbi:hypothetical protein D9M71_690520 [compost metagenome]